MNMVKKKKKKKYVLENGIRVITTSKRLKKLCEDRMLFFEEGLPFKHVLHLKLAEIRLKRRRFKKKLGTKKS